NGTTDTVDVTTNGAGFANFTIARVNAALVTLNPREIPLPIPRRSAAATYDPAVSRVVLTTGYAARVGAVTTRGPTSVEAYNPATHTWSELIPSGLASDPSARSFTAMAHAAGVNVLFGGFELLTGNIVGDTWELNASTRVWTRYDVSGPSSRYRPVMTTDGGDGVLLFGGIADFSFSSELWRYRPATHTWTQLAPTNAGPSPRDFYTGAFLPATNELWVCGGSAARNDCWAYSVTNNTWSTKPALPVTGIVRHSMAQLGGRIYVFGGTVNGTLSNTLYLFDNGAWSAVTLPAGNTPPPARQSATLVSDGSRLLLFGGYVTTTTTPLGDYWTYEVATGWTKRNAPEAPAPVVTITGNISGRNSGAASAEVNLTTSSGFVATTTVQLTPPVSGTGPATGTWSIPNVPAGEDFEIVATNRDGNFTYPEDTSYLWAYAESGVLPAGTTTYDIAFQEARMPVTTVTANLTLPPGWLGADYFAYSRRERPGYGAIGNGTTSIDNFAGTVRWDFFSPTAPVTQNNVIQAHGGSPAHCDDAYLYLNGSAGGSVNLAFPAGPPVMGPGRSLCYPTGTGLRRDGFLETTHNFGRGVAAGDLNGDGAVDMVSVGDSADVTVYFNSDIYWDISRKRAQLTTGVTDPVAVAVADLDRDGKGEVLVVNASGGTGGVGTLQIFEWSSGTTFIPLPNTLLGMSSSGIAVGDVNGDGRADVVVTNAGNNSLTTLIGNGSGGFSSTVTSTLTGVTGPQRVVLGEVTGDGRVDAVVLNAGSGNVSVLAGNNAGSFSSATTLNTGATPVSIALGTLNGDARLDLVVANQSPDSFSVFHNDGTTIGFSSSTSYPLTNLPLAIGVAELTRDNIKDVVVAQYDEVKIYRGTGSSFTRSFSTSGVSQARDLVLADIVQDGYADVLVVGDSELAMYSGLSPAIPAPEGAYAFIAPGGTRLFSTIRRSGGITEWEYYSRAQPGPVSYSYPLPSTLAPSRPAPRGQLVDWIVQMNIYPASSTFSPDAWGVRNLKRDATAYVDNGLAYLRD
ncbi:MAG TPA: FG-GAP-like repeat-containing protein, partial [Myxococcaceae bacterium]|nr:FG-GAP-like repeat-containing protein [Myxococcaceae bacterium]